MKKSLLLSLILASSVLVACSDDGYEHPRCGDNGTYTAIKAMEPASLEAKGVGDDTFSETASIPANINETSFDGSNGKILTKGRDKLDANGQKVFDYLTLIKSAKTSCNPKKKDD